MTKNTTKVHHTTSQQIISLVLKLYNIYFPCSTSCCLFNTWRSNSMEYFWGLNSIQSHKEVFSMTALSWLLILQAFNNLIMAIYTYMWAMVEIFLSTLKLLLYIPTLPKTFYTFWAYDKPIVTWYWTLVFLWC